MVSVLAAWIFPVTDRDDPLRQIDITPFDLADFFLTHGGGDRKAHNPAHGDDHVGLGIEAFEQGADFVFSWSTVTLHGSADQTKAGEGGSRKADALCVHVDAVDCRCMGKIVLR